MKSVLQPDNLTLTYSQTMSFSPSDKYTQTGVYGHGHTGRDEALDDGVHPVCERV
jgi:hypothetical protein